MLQQQIPRDFLNFCYFPNCPLQICQHLTYNDRLWLLKAPYCRFRMTLTSSQALDNSKLPIVQFEVSHPDIPPRLTTSKSKSVKTCSPIEILKTLKFLSLPAKRNSRKNACKPQSFRANKTLNTPRVEDKSLNSLGERLTLFLLIFNVVY